MTIDDSDLEYSVSAYDDDDADIDNAFSSNESDSGIESDGFLRGENGSDETASGRSFLADPSNAKIF